MRLAVSTPRRAQQRLHSTPRRRPVDLPRYLPASQVNAGLDLLDARYTASTLREIAAGLLCVDPDADNVRYPRAWDDTVGLQVFLSGLVVDSPSRRHTLARLRGAQAGFLLHGLHLALPDNLDIASGPGMTTLDFTEHTAARLRAGVANPVHAAALTAVYFTGLSPDLLTPVPLSALSDDATVLHITAMRATTWVADGAVGYHIPDPARPLMAAARTFQHLRGPERNHRLLSTGIGASAATLVVTAETCALPLPIPAQHFGRPWHLDAKGWWISHPLHAKNGPPP
ncbi:hypothetical protein GCM10027614_08610 [Micromonospora vulcania]